ncbi:hypothetical protein [Bradyrhizobium glycinis]|uniref:hypothetical protein n=1 Tax=Bradyrhizobium glycinis TaxID=2751812 RepID=UPI0018D80EF7|nr:hypothetical protein [Bradyrhizobium glycinis]MBH5373450.1 hypothetical protein [Bradyrhizobium glycinis]
MDINERAAERHSQIANELREIKAEVQHFTLQRNGLLRSLEEATAQGLTIEIDRLQKLVNDCSQRLDACDIRANYLKRAHEDATLAFETDERHKLVLKPKKPKR